MPLTEVPNRNVQDFLADSRNWEWLRNQILTIGDLNLSGVTGDVTFTSGGVSALTFATVTSLPGGPTDGAICVFTDSLTAPTYRWLLQYEASDGYWYCLGGTPLVARSDTQRTGPGTTYANLATDPLSLTNPLAGDWDLTIEALVQNPTGTFAALSYAVGGTAANDAWAAIVGTGASNLGSVSCTTRHTGIAVSQTIAEKAKAAAAGTGTFQNRRLRAMPVRVQ